MYIHARTNNLFICFGFGFVFFVFVFSGNFFGAILGVLCLKTFTPKLARKYPELVQNAEVHLYVYIHPHNPDKP